MFEFESFLIELLKQPPFSFGDSDHLLGEEINFSSLRNEFSTVLFESLSSILWFSRDEAVEN